MQTRLAPATRSNYATPVAFFVSQRRGNRERRPTANGNTRFDIRTHVVQLEFKKASFKYYLV